MKLKKIMALMMATLILSPDAFSFCGFYVAKADSDLFNEKSEVILVRDGQRTVITMSNDFQGDVKDFAMVVPVPVILKENQIKEVDRGIFDRLDAYSAPRLVAYYDENPCYEREMYAKRAQSIQLMDMAVEEVMEDEAEYEPDYKVTIEAEYTVGVYDILILSAEESDGLQRWLVDNDYKIPSKAQGVLEPYVKNDTKFFVVKVNLERQENGGFTYLNPLQIEFESDRFMLPIRLGMANAKDAQDLVVYAFTRRGRIEAVNYRTVKVPTNKNVPLFVETYFGEFYSDLFDRSYYREGMKAVHLEYAWNVSPFAGVKCDPCVSPPPVFNDFREAGADWVRGMDAQSAVFFTRLHVRYTRDKFPQDLIFQETPNNENFQARYILTHPAQGDLSCAGGVQYLSDLENRRKREVDELQALAGWSHPGYADYITEYSTTNRDSEKYKPNRNEWGPTLPDLPPPPSNTGKLLLVAFGILGLLTLWFVQSPQRFRYRKFKSNY